MTTRKLYHDQTPKFLYFGGGDGDNDKRINPLGADGFEMNEADLWSTEMDDHSNAPQNHVPRRSKFPLKAHQQRKVPMSNAARSLPVNVPDWSMILRDEYKHHGRTNNDHDDLEFDGDNEIMLPPHEYLARTRIASFSVHEGVGRTLKGRDLSRVRNAIWKQTGFEQD
ncbi:putative senescence regulator S40 [Helianthus annuus]|uniref:Senescence regulator S40 n=1 Tax=Helianthus annuus TaxID=4232 RepID=A0A251UC48_HELAN|nr:uncharacterized protein LOC110868336 [Helianthus annuus]KAF5799243.1 putative senescence regulator S40 [Helianthus annuus]KAJ0550707.1 putative senescence regulator S40 [Helianthus annuus]KAJ0557518.1 putative senescence regulator S40 [Helianthus annuus]KAJ0563672.1 putative senescence regulator S40 [Helianthus annuus]KAJ0729004.1 putative senescence regulator S40 [Helianthus annuus]